MAIFFTTPTFARQGVVAGFVLVAPLASTPASGPISFSFYNGNSNNNVALPTNGSGTVDLNGNKLTMGVGFEHWITIGSVTYSYVQQNGDTGPTIATALAALINGTPDLNAAASASGNVVTLTPRQNTDTAVPCTSSETFASGTDASPGLPLTEELVELTGNDLIPTITKGVLFAQGEQYAPSVAPTLPAAPASHQSWLFYSSTGGFYWHNSPTPLVSDDAFLGWVVTNASRIVAFSSRRIGTGAESVIQTAPVQVVTGGTSGDTGPPPAPSFSGEVPNYLPGQVVIAGLGFATLENTAGIISVTFVLYYIDEAVGPIGHLTAALASGATSLSASAALPAASPVAVSFTFVNSGTVGGVNIGPGYQHNITIGAIPYVYVQQTGDTPAIIAAGLVEAINANNDPSAVASSSGAVVTLSPLGDNGDTVVCTASDGNSEQTLTETQPSYILVEYPESTGSQGEIIEVFATNGSSVARQQKGSASPASFPIGALIWNVETISVTQAIDGLTIGTPAFPTLFPPIAFVSKGLVAIDCWVTNEFGNSPVTEGSYASIEPGGRVRFLAAQPISLSVRGTLAVQTNATGVPAVSGLTASGISEIYATVQTEPVGSPIELNINVNGSLLASLTIPSGTSTSQVLTVNSIPGVDGLIMPASANVTVDITAVGSTTPGADLQVVIGGNPSATSSGGAATPVESAILTWAVPVAGTSPGVAVTRNLQVTNTGNVISTIALDINAGTSSALTITGLPASVTLNPGQTEQIPLTLTPASTATLGSLLQGVIDGSDGTQTMHASIILEIGVTGAVLSFHNPTVGTLPGSPIAVTFDTIGTGNVPTEVNLSAAVPSGLTVAGLPSSVNVNPGQTVSTAITLTPSSSTPLGTSMELVLTGTIGSQTVNAGVVVDVGITAVTISFEPSVLGSAAGSTVPATLQIHNTGNGPVTATLGYSATSLTITGLPSSVTLAAGQTELISSLNVTASGSAAMGASLTASVTAVVGGQTVYAFLVVDIGVLGATLSFDHTVIGASAGTAVAAELYIQGTGNVPTTVSLGATLDSGLSESGLPSSVTVNPGQVTAVGLNLTPSSSEAQGTKLNCLITATYSGQTATAAVAVEVGVTGVTISVTPAQANTTPSTGVSIVVQVTGTGNVPTEFQLEQLSGGRGGGLTGVSFSGLPSGFQTVNPGQTVTFTITATPSVHAGPGITVGGTIGAYVNASLTLLQTADVYLTIGTIFAGSVTLSGGSATVSASGVTSSSRVVALARTGVSGTAGELYATCGAGTVTITSTSSSDNGTVNLTVQP